MRSFVPRVFAAIAAVGAIVTAGPARATPSTTFWAPSTPAVQPIGVLHVTYDTYFGTKAAYPVDTGLEIGILPSKHLQAELGFDLNYPTYTGGGPLDFPILLNAKVGGPEGALFGGAPAWSVGIFGVGFEEDVTDYNVLHAMLGKTFSGVGMLSAGGYYALNENLFLSSEGDENRAGIMAGWFSPAIPFPAVDHINLAWDVQTGRNVLGATGGGVYVYFTPKVDLLMGPVFFFDEDLQPGGSSWLWSMQLDADLDF
jgi:hypothetical protein